MRQTALDENAQCKKRIQALLRALAIKRDGGCVLRDEYEAGLCGGWTKDEELILQAEHLNSRANSISYADMRNIVCLCQTHHIHWKPQHSRLYWELIHRVIGEERWEWVKMVESDKKPYRFTLYDWLKIETALKNELQYGH